MWPRHMEIAFGLWLAASPFVFRHPADSLLGWNDLGCAALLVALATASHAPRLRRIHLLELAVAAWLVGLGWIRAQGDPSPPTSQNHLVVGLLVAMFAIIPSRASRPPPGWRRFYERAGEEGR